MRLQMPNLPPTTIRDLGRLYRLDIDPLRRESSEPSGCIMRLHPKHRQGLLLKPASGFDGVRGRVENHFCVLKLLGKASTRGILPCPWPPTVRPSGCLVAHLKQLLDGGFESLL